MLASLFSNVVSEQYREISVQDALWDEMLDLNGDLTLQCSCSYRNLPTPRSFLKLDRSLIRTEITSKRHIFGHFHSNPIHLISNEYAPRKMLTVSSQTWKHHRHFACFCKNKKRGKEFITLKPALRHLHWFLFKHPSKESLQFCPTDSFSENSIQSELCAVASTWTTFKSTAILRMLLESQEASIKSAPQIWN